MPFLTAMLEFFVKTKNHANTGVYGSTKKIELVEKPDLEVAPVVEAFPPGIITNQQEGHNGKSCLNVTKDIKKFLDNVRLEQLKGKLNKQRKYQKSEN